MGERREMDAERLQKSLLLQLATWSLNRKLGRWREGPSPDVLLQAEVDRLKAKSPIGKVCIREVMADTRGFSHKPCGRSAIVEDPRRLGDVAGTARLAPHCKLHSDAEQGKRDQKRHERYRVEADRLLAPSRQIEQLKARVTELEAENEALRRQLGPGWI
jgi:hypothetical protein